MIFALARQNEIEGFPPIFSCRLSAHMHSLLERGGRAKLKYDFM